MLRTRTAALVVALAMLALPATSLAQSAGDDQYSDPLAGGGGSTSGHITNTTGGGGGSGSSGSGGGSTTSGTPSSTASNVPTASSSGTGTATPTTGEAASGTPRGQLPRTGFDVIVSFELGLAMLLSGLVGHRVLALRERRDS